MTWDLLPKNPALAAKPPAATEREMPAWSIDDVRRFLELTRETRLYPLWVLMFVCCLRRGEAAGLEWGDVDLEAGTVTIRRARVLVRGRVIDSTPKSRRSRRLLHLDKRTTAILRDHVRSPTNS